MFAATIFIVTYVQVMKPADERFARSQLTYQRAKVALDQGHENRYLFERVREAQKQVDKLWQSLPSQAEFATLAMAISELGRSERVVIPGMSYHVDKSEGQMPVKATISFKVTGEYGAVYRFIHRLETSGSYIVVESLDATRADKAHRATSNLVVFNMTVATFLRQSEPTREMS
jgi:Tfp pilus assembly protein PilO